MENYRQCTVSVMDNIADPNIKFDSNGICNYYYEYKTKEKEGVFSGSKGKETLNDIIHKIKRDGEGQKYDTILGVSGGVDSTYLALIAKEFGLRVLLFHFDNGWNSELAVKNIESISKKLNFDLYTYVVNWEEFKDVQLAYLKADVVDIEAITDHCAMVATYDLAYKLKIRNILIGTNIVTEQVLPNYWIWNKSDADNLLDIHHKYGTIKKLKSLPVMTTKRNLLYNKVNTFNFFSLLNYLDYNKSKVKKAIIEKLDWIDYGGKHYESVWTRFYQGYILPTKFKIDKRKAHLSNLIFSGQISKTEAIEELSKPIYDSNLLQQDLDFVLKKLGLTKVEFDTYLSRPRREHTEFNIQKSFWNKYPGFKIIKPIWNLIKR